MERCEKKGGIVGRMTSEIIAGVRNSLEMLGDSLEKEPIIFIDAKGGHWFNDLAQEFIFKKGIPEQEFVEWLKIGSSHLQTLNYCDVDICMMRLPKKDVIVLLQHEQKKPVSKIHKITQKEKELLSYLVQGFSNKKIAGLMKISPGTVNTHLDNIYSKLGCSNRVAACFTALKNGLFLPPLGVLPNKKS